MSDNNLKFIFDRIHVDELVEIREEARLSKNYNLSDEIRDYLDNKLIFVFDEKEGSSVHYLFESYFEDMGREYYKNNNIKFDSKRKFLEYQIQQDILAEKNFSSWLYSQLKSLGHSDEFCADVIKHI